MHAAVAAPADDPLGAAPAGAAEAAADAPGTAAAAFDPKIAFTMLLKIPML